MKQPIHILHLEDDPADRELTRANLDAADLKYEITGVKTGAEFDKELRQGGYDVILSDFRLPEYDGMSALRLVQDLCPDVPFIFVSGTMGEDAAIEGLTKGATDYVLKQKLSRLIPAIKRALTEAENRRERQSAEKKLFQANERWGKTFDAVPDLIAILDRDFRIVQVNKAMAGRLGLTPEECIGQFCYKLCHETDTSPSFCPYVQTLKEGKEHVVEVKEERLGGEFIVSASPLFDSQGQMIGIVHVARDITYRKKAEERLKETLGRLRKAIEATIQVMVSAVEARDPYTAGHQLKSADLARSIAIELGLDKERIEGIHKAGIIHDIGKVAIPSEILSKPTKLTDLEFSLIKEHSRIGYEILKNIESPWPLADIVYQHHERINGSGYPGHLKIDEILLESRILAVADVVEAMASHRPYRASLGIEAALKEIEKNKRILYDADVVDACLRLFRGKGYQFIKEECLPP